jgi:hypothetical protein
MIPGLKGETWGTRQRYTHVGKSHLEAAASRLDGVLTLPAQIDTPERH